MHAVFLRSFTIRIVEDSLGKIKWLLVDMILEWIKSWTSTYFQRISTSRPSLDLELGIFPETEETNSKVAYVPPNRALADHKQPPVSAIGRNINWRRGSITRSNHGMATRQMAGQRTYCNKNIWEGLLLSRHQIFSRWRIWTSTLSIISLFLFHTFVRPKQEADGYSRFIRSEIRKCVHRGAEAQYPISRLRYSGSGLCTKILWLYYIFFLVFF